MCCACASTNFTFTPSSFVLSLIASLFLNKLHCDLNRCKLKSAAALASMQKFKLVTRTTAKQKYTLCARRKFPTVFALSIILRLLHKTGGGDVAYCQLFQLRRLLSVFCYHDDLQFFCQARFLCKCYPLFLCNLFAPLFQASLVRGNFPFSVSFCYGLSLFCDDAISRLHCRRLLCFSRHRKIPHEVPHCVGVAFVSFTVHAFEKKHKKNKRLLLHQCSRFSNIVRPRFQSLGDRNAF